METSETSLREGRSYSGGEGNAASSTSGTDSSNYVNGTSSSSTSLPLHPVIPVTAVPTDPCSPISVRSSYDFHTLVAADSSEYTSPGGSTISAPNSTLDDFVIRTRRDTYSSKRSRNEEEVKSGQSVGSEASGRTEETATMSRRSSLKPPSRSSSFSHISDSDKLNRINSLIPRRLVRRMAELPAEMPIVSFEDSFDAAILFADISGFSALAAKLEGITLMEKRRSDQHNLTLAADALALCINNCLQQMVQSILDQGGDIIKFAGDAILAVYPVRRKVEFKDAVITACTVALKLISMSFPVDIFIKDLLKISAPGEERLFLTVHCAVGAGKTVGYNVGGVNNKWEYFIAGEAVNETCRALLQSAAKQCTVTNSVYEIVKSCATCIKLSSSAQDVFRLVNLIPSDTPSPSVDKSSFIAFENDTDSFSLSLLRNRLKSYVASSLLTSFATGVKQQAELRFCTVVFMRVMGIQYNAPNTLRTIQTLVTIVQKQVNRFEGTLCRYIVDDKGTGLLIVFGLPSMQHENDSYRAVRTAQNCQNQINAIKSAKLSSYCGVTTGRVFCGIVGGDQRCEYTVHGYLVNVAASIMSTARQSVICDETTFNQTKDSLLYKKPFLHAIKGVKEKMALYTPVESKIFRENESFPSQTKFIGREKEMKHICRKFDELISIAACNATVIISGAAGTGKTRLVHQIIDIANENNVLALVGNAMDTEVSTLYYPWRAILSTFFQLNMFSGVTSASHRLQLIAQKLPLEYQGSINLFRIVFPSMFPTKSSEKRSNIISSADTALFETIVVAAIKQMVNSLLYENRKTEPISVNVIAEEPVVKVTKTPTAEYRSVAADRKLSILPLPELRSISSKSDVKLDRMQPVSGFFSPQRTVADPSKLPKRRTKSFSDGSSRLSNALDSATSETAISEMKAEMFPESAKRSDVPSQRQTNWADAVRIQQRYVSASYITLSQQ
jgi:class 3 adenylate cyclase